MEMTEQIVKSIMDAELILVGIGEELDSLKKIKASSSYEEISKKIQEKWILPFVRKAMLNKTEKETQIYGPLSQVLENKNYFIISTCQDGGLGKASFLEERIVEPCGGYKKLQCSDACSNSLYEIPDDIMCQIEGYLRGECKESELKEPLCPVCGKPLVFNNVEADNYVEEGYIGKWNIYKKWLQGTVNKKVCILEVGVGMKYPSVIRWPFEKIAYFNQKSDFFRVHSMLYQIPHELGERGKGICANPEKFLKELSNGF